MVELASYEELRAGVEQLWAMIERESIRTPEGWQESALASLWGPCVQALRHSRVVFDLVDRGYSREALVNARVALEHAVTAQWVLHRDGALDRFTNHLQRNHKGEAARLGEWLDDDQVRRSVAAIDDPEGDGLPNFHRIVDELTTASAIVNPYGNLSLAVHVRADTTLAYLDGAPGDIHTLNTEPRITNPYEGPYVAAMAASLAANVLLTLAEDGEGLDRLDNLASQLHLPTYVREDLPAELRRRDPALPGD